MSTQTPSQPTASLAQQQEQYRILTRNLSIGLLIICPTIALLPPRRLNFYTFGLIGMMVVSANHLTQDRSGRSTLQRLGSVSGDGLPTEKARLFQKQMQEKREMEGKSQEKGVLDKIWMGGEGADWKEKRLREEQDALDRGEGYGSLIMDQISEVWRGGKKGDSEDTENEKKD
jgi:hypothetical protein